MDTEPKHPSPTTSSVIADIRLAISFMTRLPVGGIETDLARASWAFPVAGLLVGCGGGGTFVIMSMLGTPSLVAALVALASMSMLTGGLHEDGLADTADGFGGGSPERRLEIMRDSHIGAYGVLALIFSVGIRAAALSAIPAADIGFTAIVAAATLSRGWLPGVMHILPLASESGLAALVGRPAQRTALLAIGLGALITCIFLGLSAGISAIVISGLSATATVLLARRMIGGYNGDTLGATQQIAETIILVGIAASFSAA